MLLKIISTLICILFLSFFTVLLYVLYQSEKEAISTCEKQGGIYRQSFKEKPFCMVPTVIYSGEH